MADIGDLLVNSDNVKDPEEIAKAARQEAELLATGLASVGAALASAVAGDHGLLEYDVAKIGWHVERVATLIGRLVEMSDRAEYQVRTRSIRAAA